MRAAKSEEAVCRGGRPSDGKGPPVVGARPFGWAANGEQSRPAGEVGRESWAARERASISNAISKGGRQTADSLRQTVAWAAL